MAERDYTKFLKEGERLNIRMIPRDIYLEMLKRYRQDTSVIDAVFDDLFWLWDLNELEKQARAEGREVSRVELADELISEMADDDWWKVIASFEEHLMDAFASDPGRWAEFLDPVYDMQERDGWTRRQ